MNSRPSRRFDLISHLFAAGAALLYAWQVSQSAYVQTGLQFIAPLLVIMAAHLIWLAVTQGLSPGFSTAVYRRSAQSALGVALVIVLLSFTAPMPASAAGNGVVSGILTVLFCVAIIAVVGAMLAVIIMMIGRLLAALFNKVRPKDKQGPDTRFFDLGSIAVTCAFLCAASLEGLPKAYAFRTADQSGASYFVKASPAEVWITMEQATSPQFPLPDILSVFPQPVDVVTDEGTSLGATRKVMFRGREGTGTLTLRVVERTATKAVFEVISDTSPIAHWVAHRRLVYQVQPENDGTRLDVTLEYDRLLAPAWFFSPTVKGATYLAMDVLARDVKARAEAQGTETAL